MTQLKIKYTANLCISNNRVVLGRLDEFLSTSCIASLSFLDNTEEGDPENLSYSVKEYLEKELQKPLFKPVSKRIQTKGVQTRMRKSGVAGIIKRTRSIQVDQYDPGKAFKQSFVEKFKEQRPHFFVFLICIFFHYYFCFFSRPAGSALIRSDPSSISLVLLFFYYFCTVLSLNIAH